MNNVHAAFEIMGLIFSGAAYAAGAYALYRIGRMVSRAHADAARATRYIKRRR